MDLKQKFTREMNKENFEILKMVFENYFKIDMFENTRDYKYVYARMILFKVLREDFGLKYAEISEMSGKHHATVIHFVKKFHDIMSYDKRIVKDYENILFNYEISCKTDYKAKDVYRLVCMLEQLKKDNEQLKEKTQSRMFKLIESIHPSSEPNIFYKLEAIVKMNNFVDKKEIV